MAEDFRQERLWKEAAARGLSLSVLSRPAKDAKAPASTADPLELKSRAKAISDMVKVSHLETCPLTSLRPAF